LPFEFIRPIIELYKHSDGGRINLDMSKSGFKLKKDYNVTLYCGIQRPDLDATATGSYYPGIFNCYYFEKVNIRRFIPPEKSSVPSKSTTGRTVIKKENINRRITGIEKQNTKDKLKKNIINIDGTIRLNKKGSIIYPDSYKSTIEHEVLHFVQDILAFETWLFSKSDKPLTFFRDNMMTIGAYKSKTMKDYTKNQGFNFSGRKDDSSRILHELRPVELQTNLNSSVVDTKRAYIKEILRKWQLENKIYNFNFNNLTTQKKNDLIATINGNDNNSKSDWFKNFMKVHWHGGSFIWKIDKNTAVTDEIKKYFLKELYKNFMEPMEVERIIYYLPNFPIPIAVHDPDPVPVPKRKIKRTRDPIDVPDPVPKRKVKKIIDPAPAPKLPKKKIIDPDKTKRKK
jgi:hypothetical protein